MKKLILDKTPIPVKKSLRDLGVNLKNARKRRRISTALMAEKADISRATLNKIENGLGSVSLISYAKVLFILGLVDKLGSLAELEKDSIGVMLADDRLPQRIRYRSTKDPNIS